MTRLIFTILGTLTFTLQIAAQNKLTAEVLNAYDNERIEYANLKVYSVSDSSVIAGGFTNEKGKVVVDISENGPFYATVTAFGFEKNVIQDIGFDGLKNKVNLGRVFLNPEKSQDLDEITVKAEKKVIETSFDKRVYSTEEDLTSQGGDVTDILNNIPSVEVDNDGNISLRGSGNVMILIDGRPSSMSQSAEGALDGIPASSVERIEIVTNPSARYDPDGTAGIINIVLKKNKLRGVNTKVDISGATGNLYNGSVNFNARNEKINFYTSYSFRYREGYRNNMNDRVGSFNDTIIRLFQDRSGADDQRSHTGKLGADFFLSDRDVIGVSLSGSMNDRIRSGDQFNFESFDGDLNRFWNRTTIDPRDRLNADINVDYKRDFEDKGGSLLAVMTQSFGWTESFGLYEEYYFRPDGMALSPGYFYQYQDRYDNTSNFTASLDVEKNVSDKFRYELGAKTYINYELRGNYLEFLDFDSNEIVPDSNVINDFRFDEQIFALYGIVAHQPFERLKYQVGMRLEQAFTQPQLLTTGEDFENNYFSPFPSGHLIFGDDKMGEFSLSYSRRINRPRSWNLNPFPMYSDPLNLRQGNPALQPEYINSFEFGYQKNFDKITLSGSVFYRETKDKIQRVREFLPNNVSVNTFANIAESQDYGVELIMIYSPFSWWKNIISFNGFESRLAANIGGVDLRNSGFVYNTKLNSTFNLFKGTTSIQVNAQYISPTFTVQGYYQRFPGVDLAINRNFMNKQLSVGLRLTDLFDQQGFYLEVSDGIFLQESMYKWETRRLYLTVSYKFGRRDSDREKNQKPKVIEIEEGDL